MTWHKLYPRMNCIYFRLICTYLAIEGSSANYSRFPDELANLLRMPPSHTSPERVPSLRCLVLLGIGPEI